MGTSYRQAVIRIGIFSYCKLLPFDPEVILSFCRFAIEWHGVSTFDSFFYMIQGSLVFIKAKKLSMCIVSYSMVSAGCLGRSRAWFTTGLICGYCSH